MDNKPAPGFTLPPASDAPPATPPAQTTPPVQGSTQEVTPTPLPAPPSPDTHSRDLAIGSGLVVVLLIAFFFAKNAYANMLVARKVAPRSANAAGWWLFIALSVLALGIVFGALDSNRFLVMIYIVPLAAVEILSIVLLAISSRR
jgi:hypothetical protein